MRKNEKIEKEMKNNRVINDTTKQCLKFFNYTILIYRKVIQGCWALSSKFLLKMSCAVSSF